jgi:hypothetical protein
MNVYLLDIGHVNWRRDRVDQSFVVRRMIMSELPIWVSPRTTLESWVSSHF